MLFLLVVCALILESWTVSEQCNRSPNMKFSVSTWRNESGHRLVAADLQSDESNDDGVSLTVELFNEKCGDDESVILKTQSSSRSKQQTPDSISAAPTESMTISEILEKAGIRPGVGEGATRSPTVVPLPGYRHFPGLGYYKLLPQRMNWGDGVEACKKEGTRMLLVESQEEIDTLWAWTGCCPWVGVYRESSSGPWINILGQLMNTSDFFGWIPAYPTDEGDCVLLNSSSRRGTSNYMCSDEDKIICEQAI
ncbi:uncharacterized protein [Anabrus simplex]|uniref:uncharacterized protein n=1 Tax=Anabrus simplex TaxID=316456 RepID=UPI0035A3AC55